MVANYWYGLLVTHIRWSVDGRPDGHKVQFYLVLTCSCPLCVSYPKSRIVSRETCYIRMCNRMYCLLDIRGCALTQAVSGFSLWSLSLLPGDSWSTNWHRNKFLCVLIIILPPSWGLWWPSPSHILLHPLSLTWHYTGHKVTKLNSMQMLSIYVNCVTWPHKVYMTAPPLAATGVEHMHTHTS